MQQPEHALASVHTSNFPDLLRQLGCSLVVTTYQAGRVILVRHDSIDESGTSTDTLNTHFRPFDRPMGVCEKDGRLSIGGATTVWEYRNVPAAARKLEPPGRHDACFVPRRTHFTGNIDIHEMAWSDDDRLWLVNTRFSCLCTLDADNSFHPRWRPPFVTAYAPEDRCHLNGLAMRDGVPRYVTALGQTDSMGGWRADKAAGGVLLDVASGEVVLRGLSMPHSPRWYRDRLWVLESGKGTLSVLEPGRDVPATIARLPGFTRGIDFVGPLAFIGLSKVRESASFSGIPIVRELTERICGVWVVHIDTGEVVAFLRFEAGVEEIFAVQVLRGIAYPEMLMPDDPSTNLIYVLPDAALAEVSLQTPEQLEQSPEAWLARGVELFRKQEFDQAVAAFRECLARQPNYPDARYSLGVALAEAGEFAEAMEHLQAARAQEPDRSEIHLSLGSLCQWLGRHDEARQAFEAAIERRPDNASAHVSLGVLLLQLGDFKRGFDEYRWRLQMGDGPAWHGPHPEWDGEPAPGRTLLVHAARDDPRHLLLLARYLPRAAHRVHRLLVTCPPAYAPLLSTVQGVVEVRRPGEVRSAEFDLQVPIGELPRLFGTTPDSVPSIDGGLDLGTLKRRGPGPPAAANAGSARVGLVRPDGDARGVCRREAFDALLGTSGIEFHEIASGSEPNPGLALTVAGLDLVIGVDSTAVHLAGALGTPVWVLLGRVNDWCWPAASDRSPWYPAAKVFRELVPADHAGLMASVVAELGEWRARRDRATGPVAALP